MCAVSNSNGQIFLAQCTKTFDESCHQQLLLHRLFADDYNNSNDDYMYCDGSDESVIWLLLSLI